MAESLTFYTDLLGFRLSDILDFNRVVRDKKTIEGLGDTNGYMLRYSTCLGVGRPRGLFFQQGDEVVLTIGNLGTLRTPIIRDTTTITCCRCWTPRGRPARSRDSRPRAAGSSSASTNRNRPSCRRAGRCAASCRRRIRDRAARRDYPCRPHHRRERANDRL